MKKKVLLASRLASAPGQMVAALEAVFEKASQAREQIRLKHNFKDE